MSCKMICFEDHQTFHIQMQTPVFTNTSVQLAQPPAMDLGVAASAVAAAGLKLLSALMEENPAVLNGIGIREWGKG